MAEACVIGGFFFFYFLKHFRLVKKKKNLNAYANTFANYFKIKNNAAEFFYEQILQPEEKKAATDHLPH